jgi:hypothetical protein
LLGWLLGGIILSIYTFHPDTLKKFKQFSISFAESVLYLLIMSGLYFFKALIFSYFKNNSLNVWIISLPSAVLITFIAAIGLSRFLSMQ